MSLFGVFSNACPFISVNDDPSAKIIDLTLRTAGMHTCLAVTIFEGIMIDVNLYYKFKSEGIVVKFTLVDIIIVSDLWRTCKKITSRSFNELGIVNEVNSFIELKA